MTNSNGPGLDYADRLAAVTAALADAEAAGRYGDAEALRLAQQVLSGLIQEVRQARPRTVDHP